MRKQLLWLALGLGLSACAANPQPQFPNGRLDTSKACAEWRWIGVSRPGAQCPDVSGWTVRPLFAQLAPSQQEWLCDGEEQASEKVPGPEVIRELNRFCVYEIADRKKSLKQLPFPPAVSADLVRFDQDCAALALTDTYQVAETWMPDTEAFLARAGHPRRPLEINNRLGVRLAFLDTEPTGVGLPKRSRNSLHGFILAHLAQQMVCNGEATGNCAAQVTTRLAMPIIEFNPKHPQANRIDKERGGFLGMQSDLAEAIRKEVDSWLPERKSQRHLVLNLSMAWDGALFGGLNEEQVSDMRAGTQAVYQALRYAAGYDVLVLAAAGNQKQDPCVNFGPLLPAAWERGAPEADCRDSPQAPLVYAVGGVQADGSPLANSRPGGMPRRVAYGETEVFTGSSVATAVVSSIAAVVWDTNPDWSSDQVMRFLDGTENEPPRLRADATGTRQTLKASSIAKNTGLKADFWFPDPLTLQTAPAVRRLSLCSVLQQDCSPPATSLFVPAAVHALETRAGEAPDASHHKDQMKGSCQPWLFPQPEFDPCPTCPPPRPGS